MSKQIPNYKKANQKAARCSGFRRFGLAILCLIATLSAWALCEAATRFDWNDTTGTPIPIGRWTTGPDGAHAQFFARQEYYYILVRDGTPVAVSFPEDTAGEIVDPAPIPGDGTDAYELIELSRAESLDLDEDGLSDAEEGVFFHTAPLDPDTDADGLTDGDEVNDYGTDPHESDTDGDGTSDGEEVAQQSDPLEQVGAPRRNYRFIQAVWWDPFRIFRETGESEGGILSRRHDFGRGFDNVGGAGPGIADGIASGQVYSNLSGETYWAWVESPTWVGKAQWGNSVELEQSVRYRKVSPGASYKMTITGLHLLNVPIGTPWFPFDPDAEDPYKDYDTLVWSFHGCTWPTLLAKAEFKARAYTGKPLAENPDEIEPPFFQTDSGATLTTARWRPESADETLITYAGFETYRNVDARLTKDVIHDDGGIWTEADFDVSITNDVVSTADLAHPIPIPIDLSKIAVGEEFTVWVQVRVRAWNELTPEGGAIAFFRDPVELGGSGQGMTVETSGLEPVPNLDGPIPEWTATPVPCDPDVTEGGVLEFDASDYVADENLGDTIPSIFITRTGGTQGMLSAIVTLEGNTATPGEDFETGPLVVVFADGEAGPLRLRVPVIPDSLYEPEETLTLMLHSAPGCLSVGERNTATVRIAKNDWPPAGVVSFTSGAVSVAESEDVATLTLIRKDGDFGSFSVHVDTADASAISTPVGAADYETVSQIVTFADGDFGPHTVSVPIHEDRILEAEETLTVAIRPYVDGHSTGEPSTAVVTIVDNDADEPSTVQFDAEHHSLKESDGGVTLFVTRFGDVSQPASVTVSFVSGDATPGTDFEPLEPTTLHFEAGDATPKPIQLMLVNDTEAEADESIEIGLSAPSNVSTGEIGLTRIEIIDDDRSGWGTAYRLAENGQGPDIAIGPDGTAMAVWAAGNVTASRWTAAGGWEAPEEVSPDAPGSPFRLSVSVGSEEHAAVAWTKTQPFASHYVHGTGWGTPHELAPHAALYASPQVASTADGSAAAIWLGRDPEGTYSVWTAELHAGAWNEAIALEQRSETAGATDIVMNTDGTILAAWSQPDSDNYPWDAIWLARKRPGDDAWIELWRGNSRGMAKTANPDLSLDPSGNVFVVWEDRYLGQSPIPWANRYDATLDVWSGPAELKVAEPRELQGTKQPKVAAIPNGDAIAVWTHEDKDERVWYVWANHYDAQTGHWGSACRLGGSVEAASARVATDAHGNAVAVWGSVSSDGRLANASAYSAADDLWSPVEVLSTETSSVSSQPSVAMTPDGHAIVVWQQVDGVYSTYYIVP